MRRMLAPLLAVLILAVPVSAGQTGSRIMSGWFNVSSPDGWNGRRYMDGNDVFAEEFDSNGDGRIDIWRFYRRGTLSSEERDLGGEGRINYQTRWEPRERRLLTVLRDTNWRGVNDLEIESPANRSWEIREDRNLDGVTDRILLVDGPNDLFERLGMDLSRQRNVVDNIPREYWRELWSDDAFTGSITDYRRFSKGEFSQYGEWENGKVVWRKVRPDFIPPPPSASPAPGGGRRPADPTSGGSVGPIATPFTGIGPADPYLDPRRGPPYLEPRPGAAVPDPLPAEPNRDGQPGAPYSYEDPVAAPVATPGRSDRTRYEGMPPGDSAARSLPAPMRPPGVGPR